MTDFSFGDRLSLLRFVLFFFGPYKAYFEICPSIGIRSVPSTQTFFHRRTEQGKFFAYKIYICRGNPVIFAVLRTKINTVCKDGRFEASYAVCQMKTVHKTFTVLPKFCLCHCMCRILIRLNKNYQAI